MRDVVRRRIFEPVKPNGMANKCSLRLSVTAIKQLAAHTIAMLGTNQRLSRMPPGMQLAIEGGVGLSGIKEMHYWGSLATKRRR